MSLNQEHNASKDGIPEDSNGIYGELCPVISQLPTASEQVQLNEFYAEEPVGNSSKNEIAENSPSISSSDDDQPAPSWFKAATILLSLKNSAEARLKAIASGPTSKPTLSSHLSPSVEEEKATEHNDKQVESNGCNDLAEDGAVEEGDHRNVVTEASSGESNIEGESLASDDQDVSTTCQLCYKIYSRPSTLKAHMRTHTGEKPFKCSICEKSFSQDANLKAHLRVHSKEKPFKCQVCQRRFAQSSSVTTHMRIHSGERPYQCRVCSRGFADSSTLTKHLRIHTGEKPYHCRICRMSFSQSGNLSRHMRVHRRKK